MPLKDYCKSYPWPKLASLRWLIWKLENMMGEQAPFITRFGKRLLIDPEAFEKWVRENPNWRENERKIGRPRENRRNAESTARISSFLRRKNASP